MIRFHLALLAAAACTHVAYAGTAADSAEAAGIQSSRAPLSAPLQRDPAARQAALDRLGDGGILLFVESSNDRVMALDPATGDVIDENFIGPDPDNLATPVNAILSADGSQVLISNQLNDVVQAYDLATGDYVGIFVPDGGVNTAIADNLRGIELQDDGRLLLSVGGGGNIDSIARFDTDGVFVDQFIAAGAGALESPFDVLRIDQGGGLLTAGNYLVSEGLGGGNLRQYDGNGEFIGLYSTAGTFAQQIDQAANGNILVASFSVATTGIYEFSPDGTPVGVYDPPELGGYRGVHELPNGNLLVSNGAGLHEIERSNTLVRTIVPTVSGRYIELAQPGGAVDDVIFADGFELPPVAECAWDTALGTPGGSVGSIGVWVDELYVGASGAGAFGGVPGGVQRVDVATGTVSALGTTELVDGFVTDFVPYDDGGGERLFIAGAFNGVRFGGAELPDSRGLVAWDGAATTTVPGSPFAEPLTFAQTATRWNAQLVVGGSRGAVEPPQKPLLSLWDGTDWQVFNEEFEGTVAPVLLAAETFQGDLYFGGRFARIRVPDGVGGEIVTESVNVMGYDGTDFFSVGGGVNRATSPVSQVLALKTFDDGSGEALYIGGRFDQSVSGTPLFAVAKWDGTTLSAVGAGFPMPSEVRAFEVYDDGSGAALYAVGSFVADTLGTPMRRFARLVDSEWVEVAGGIGENPNRARVLPDGTLAVAGSFTEVGLVDTVPGSGPSNGVAVLACALPE